MNSKIVSIQSYLVYSLPIMLLTGPFLPDLAIVLCGILFIFLSIKNREWHYYSNPISIIFFTWCIYIILRSLLSTHPILSLDSSLFYFRFGFFALSIWYIIDKNPNFIKIFTLVISSTFIIVIIDSYIQLLTGYNSLGFTLFYPDVYTESRGPAHRLSGFFNDKLILGSYLARLLPIIFALITLQYSNSKLIVVLNMLLLIATDLLVFAIGERSAFFYIILATIVIVTFVQRWRLLRIYTVLISIIIITTVSMVNKEIKYRMIDYTLDQLNITSLIPSKNKEHTELIEDKIIVFSPHHQRHYISALKMFSHNPFFGVGPKLFRIKCKDKKYFIEDSCSTHPHNTYIQLLSETGIIGFVPVFFGFLFICFIYTRQLFRNIFNNNFKYINDYQICLYCAVLISLWPIVPTGSIFNNWLSVIYFMPIGFLLSSYSRKIN